MMERMFGRSAQTRASLLLWLALPPPPQSRQRQRTLEQSTSLRDSFMFPQERDLFGWEQSEPELLSPLVRRSPLLPVLRPLKRSANSTLRISEAAPAWILCTWPIKQRRRRSQNIHSLAEHGPRIIGWTWRG